MGCGFRKSSPSGVRVPEAAVARERIRRMRRDAIILGIAQALGAIVWVVGAARADESVVNSKHDLSAQGPGPIRAVQENEICVFCHTPHNPTPQTPLWNRANPRTHYRIYESSTTEARVNQPSGLSKMCLSCHDGSMALGNVLSRPVTHPIVM